MNYRKTEYARLEEILDTDCSRLSTEELKKMLDAELDKPAEMINTELIHVLLDILEPPSPTQDQIDQGFTELVDMIESDIAWRSFVNSGGEPFQFQTVCDDIAFLMVEQYEKLGRKNPFEVQLIRDTAKKGEAALYIVIATIFQGALDTAILGAAQGANDFLVVADDLIGGLTGEDLEIQLELADLHMNSIHQLIRYAEIGGCENLTELNKIAEESQSKLDHIRSVATRANPKNKL